MCVIVDLVMCIYIYIHVCVCVCVCVCLGRREDKGVKRKANEHKQEMEAA